MLFFRSALLTLLFLLGAATVSAQSPQYTVTDLGPFFYPRAINDSGQIAGERIQYTVTPAGTVGRMDAVLYTDGLVKNITPPDGVSARAWGLNNLGDLVGEVSFCDFINGSCVNSRHRAFIYSSSRDRFTVLGTLGGRSSLALGINDLGQVTGYSEVDGSSSYHAFIFKDLVLTDIGAGSGAASTMAQSINASGQVAGYASSPTSSNGAFLYNNGSFLFFEPRGGAKDINNRGDVVGGISGNDDGSGRAFLYSDGAMQDLGTLNGGPYATANAINNVGQMVGASGPGFFYFDGLRAFIYRGGVMQDLNALVAAAPGRVLNSATDINDAGQIVTQGQINGEDHGFLLTPTEPMLLTEPNTNKAIAVQSVMFLSGPFKITTPHNLSSDTRTRLTILVRNMETVAGESIAPPAVQAEDSLHRIIPLPVEFVGKVPGFSWLTQIVVRLPDELNGSGDIELRVSFRGRTSNKAAITVASTTGAIPQP